MPDRASDDLRQSHDGTPIVWPCEDLAAELAYFVERLAFRLERIFPADDPRLAVISGHAIRLELRREPGARPELALPDFDGGGSRGMRAPSGTLITISSRAGELQRPPPSGPLVAHTTPQPVVQTPQVPPRIPPLVHAEPVVSRAGEADAWVTGRAGMLYRDLLPGRLGGRFAASHIRIPRGGPVPDSVHFHAIRFQMIFCVKGWVRVVYEDQGPPFVLRPGDCVLQPPRIRHRVLEASDGVEVLELACPAEHDTWFDHELELPTAEVRPERAFDGQRFVRHVAATAGTRAQHDALTRGGAGDAPWRRAGWTCRELGLAEATGGLAAARVARPAAPSRDDATRSWQDDWEHDGELLFLALLDGSLTVHIDGHEDLHLGAGDSVALPPRRSIRVSDPARDLELLEVCLPETCDDHARW